MLPTRSGTPEKHSPLYHQSSGLCISWVYQSSTDSKLLHYFLWGNTQSKLKTSVQCWDRIRTQRVTGLSPAKTLRWPGATQKDVHLACKKAWLPEGAQYFGLSLGKRRHSPVPNCFQRPSCKQEREALQKGQKHILKICRPSTQRSCKPERNVAQSHLVLWWKGGSSRSRREENSSQPFSP